MSRNVVSIERNSFGEVEARCSCRKRAVSILLGALHAGADREGVVASRLLPLRSRGAEHAAVDAHQAVADSLAELAPTDQRDPSDPLHRYASRAEADHRWGYGDSAGVLASLRARSAGRAQDERERWQRWTRTLAAALGAEHPDTLTARANLAAWTGEAGDAAAARDRFAELLPIRERVSGAEHPHTVTDRANLAYWTGEAGDGN